MKFLQAIKITASVVLISVNLIANAQKLSSVQEVGVLPPANIKIDGKLNEWNDTFQAYNKSTMLYYTLANDDKNLYLAIKCSSQVASSKIIAGGISFIVNSAGKKSDKDAGIVIFPVANISGGLDLARSIKPVGATGGPTAIDTIETNILHKEAISAAKEVKLQGIKEITDSVVSVYNDYGIKAALNYDAKWNLVYELAIPIKYLNIKEGVPFAYSIKLNGIQTNNNQPVAPSLSTGGGAIGNPDRDTRVQTVTFVPTTVGPGSAGGRGATSPMDDMQSMTYPTDFWGKYILVKK
jgi:hypothetical protein